MQASDQAVKLLHSYYELVDAMKIDEFMPYFTPDARMVFASLPPFQGREAIREGLSTVLGSIAGIRHDLQPIWRLTDDTVFFEVAVTYTRKDGKSVPVPGCAVCVLEGDAMREQRIYVDVTPVFA